MNYTLDELIELSSNGKMDKNSSEFKDKIYEYILKYGVDYETIKKIINIYGERNVLDSIDVEKVVYANGGERIFTVLANYDMDFVLDKIAQRDDLKRAFLEKLDYNYSAFINSRNPCTEKKIEIINQINEGDYTDNIDSLIETIDEKEREKILFGNYNDNIVFAALNNSSKEAIEKYMSQTTENAIKYLKRYGTYTLENKKVQIPSNVLKTKEFFNIIRPRNSISKFRENLNHINRQSYNDTLNQRVKKYERDILENIDEKEGILKHYFEDIDLDDIKNNDPYIYDPNAIECLNEIRASESYFHEAMDNISKTLRNKYNLNINAKELENIEIKDITDNQEIIQDLEKMKKNVIEQNENTHKEKEDAFEKLRDISKKKYTETFFDYTFADTQKDVHINIKEMLRYNSHFEKEDKLLDESSVEFYNEMLKFSDFDIHKQTEVFKYTKDKNVMAKLYEDFSRLKMHAYKEIINALHKPENNISLEKTSDYGVETYELKGEPFYMLVRTLSRPYEEETNRNQDCYSLISGDNLQVYGNENHYIYGYDDLDPKKIINMYESDSSSYYSDNNTTSSPNRIMTKEELTQIGGYSEINIKNELTEEGKYYSKYKTIPPKYLVTMKKEPSKEEIEEAKRLKIPLVMIDKERYHEKHMEQLENEKYDFNIN